MRAAIPLTAAAVLACVLTPVRAAAAFVLGPGGNSVYDSVNNVNWLTDGNLAATNRFGLPPCNGSGTGTKICINASGSMNYNAAVAWVAAMNAANYLGHTNWQLPTTPVNDSNCGRTGPSGNSFGFGCTAGALDSIYNAVGLKSPNTAVPIPNNTVGPFSNFQPYLYWSQTSAGPSQGNATFSFATGWQGANTLPNFLYLLPMVPGKLPGTPAALGTGLQVNPGGQTVYDPVTNVTWLSNANLAATNAFGLPPCVNPTSPALCFAPDGAMTWNSAIQFLANMNSTAYLGQTHWQAPTIDPSCPGYSCGGNLNPMGNLFYSQLGFIPGMSAIATPDFAVGPFHNIQPYLYWTCAGATIQSACSTDGPAPNFEWSYSFGSGFQGTDLLANSLYVTAYYVEPGSGLLCTYTLSSGGQAFLPQGGSGSFAIATQAGCPWDVAGLPSWVTPSVASSGVGNGTVAFVVLPNSGTGRSVSLTIKGVVFTVEQQGTVAGLGFIGSMPHIAAQENWTTSFTLVNKTATPATARLSLFGDPSGPLELPLTFPQQAAAGAELAASLDRTMAANASLILASAGPQTPPVRVGSAQLSATAAVDGFAIFHLIPGAQEAVVPLETRNAGSYLLAYDNTGGVVLGVAVENVSAQPGNVGIVLRDDTGFTIGTSSLPMQANGHTSFVLSSQFTATAGKRGTIEFDTPPGGQISVLGIRTTPLGSSTTLTTIPPLAAVGTNGGSIAHIATGNGWQTTFVLVNTGTTSAQIHLKFFADVTGAALMLPLSFPQQGVGASTQALSVDQALAPGASLLVVSAAPLSNPAPTTGSAQLTTTGDVGGFVIFRYNPNGQEAVVPLESRTANGFLIAFDNTAGTATGIAVNNASSPAVAIPVIVRDDNGNQIAVDTLNLTANGHLAFTLVTDKYPAAANMRGTIEFVAPPGAQIGALGIRIPVAHTFTTLPALAK